MNIKSFALVALVISVGCTSQVKLSPQTQRSHELVASVLTTCTGQPINANNIYAYTMTDRGSSYVSYNSSKDITNLVLRDCKSWDFSNALTDVSSLKQLTFLSIFSSDPGTPVPEGVLPAASLAALCQQKARVSIQGNEACSSSALPPFQVQVKALIAQ